jgi:hypothetical protein
VSSAGNHDNNIYNQNWSEQHHGLKEIRATQTTGGASGQAGSGAGRTGGNGGGNGEANGNGNGTDEDVAANMVVKFEIKVPTTTELAPNLVGKLLLVHGDMDNNVHPGNTIRLVNALIKAGKRFDFMLMPGKAHGFGDMQGYFTQMMYEYFAEHLLGDNYRGSANMTERKNGGE